MPSLGSWDAPGASDSWAASEFGRAVNELQRSEASSLEIRRISREIEDAGRAAIALPFTALQNLSISCSFFAGGGVVDFVASVGTIPGSLQTKSTIAQALGNLSTPLPLCTFTSCWEVVGGVRNLAVPDLVAA